ncbi:hypothetical protein [Streptomyces sp. LN245]|uniref:hypothetical protein n=1 Tax=Streptomyces sp. LN245 TaxID=3112975 RepID=UPI003712CD8E
MPRRFSRQKHRRPCFCRGSHPEESDDRDIGGARRHAFHNSIDERDSARAARKIAALLRARPTT